MGPHERNTALAWGPEGREGMNADARGELQELAAQCLVRSVQVRGFALNCDRVEQHLRLDGEAMMCKQLNCQKGVKGRETVLYSTT